MSLRGADSNSSPAKSAPGWPGFWPANPANCWLGNLDAQRDWGHAREYVEAMWLMLQQADARRLRGGHRRVPLRPRICGAGIFPGGPRLPPVRQDRSRTLPARGNQPFERRCRQGLPRVGLAPPRRLRGVDPGNGGRRLPYLGGNSPIKPMGVGRKPMGVSNIYRGGYAEGSGMCQN